MKSFDKLSETLGMEPMPEEAMQLPAVIDEQESTGTDALDDYNLTRDTLRGLIHKGNETLEYMMQIARGSEHPRAFEVAGTLINTVAGTAKELMALQKQMKELRKGTVEEQGPQVIKQQNNIVFQGSTSDLLKQLRNEKVIDNEDQKS